jgi:hypothetical protein
MNNKLISEQTFYEKLPQRAKMDIREIPKKQLEVILSFLALACRKNNIFYEEALSGNYLYFNHEPGSMMIPRVSHGLDHANYLRKLAVSIDPSWFFEASKVGLSEKYLRQLSKIEVYTFEELYMMCEDKNISTDDFVTCLEESENIEEIYEKNEIFYKLK